MYNFTQLQEYGYNVIMAGYNAFLTGDAGAGKSYLIQKVIDDMTKSGLNVLVTASTGIAAYNINGVTAHRAFDIPLQTLTFDKDSIIVDDTIVESDVIILEEVSMIRMDVFDFISNKIFLANEKRKRKGKSAIQFIVIGDFLQLPPVLQEFDKRQLDKYYGFDVGVGFAFQSKHWAKHDFKTIILTEVVRQDNKEFVQNLNQIRIGKKAYVDYFYDKSCKEYITNAITLCGTNKEVTSKNNEELDKLTTDTVRYESIINTNVLDTEYMCERILNLKVGARVMTLVNQKELTYTNGSLGTVKTLYPDYIIVTMDNGVDVMIERYEWKVYEYKLEPIESKLGEFNLVRYEAGSIIQFPLKLAYAVTIHKSQGQTYDYVNLSPYCWDCGQLYVALSRVRKIENLHFNYKLDMSYLVISLNVVKFYNSIVKEANPVLDTSKNIRKRNVPKDILSNDMVSILNKLNSL